MKKIEIDDLNLFCEKNDTSMTIKWTGKSKYINPSAKLIPIMNNLLEDVKENLILDFYDLEYINSSSVVPIITFVKAADEKNINVIIQYNPCMSWQKAMFKAFSSLAKILKHLTVRAIEN